MISMSGTSYSLRSQVPPPPVFLASFSYDTIGMQNRTGGGGLPGASAIYIAANRAIYWPFVIRRQVTVYRFFWVNGATASTDNVQVGVYDNNWHSVKLGTQTLASGPSAAQFDNITDTVLHPGAYYMAIWCNGTTTTMLRTNPGQRFMDGIFQQNSQTSGLPTTATPIQNTNAYFPLFGLALRASP